MGEIDDLGQGYERARLWLEQKWQSPVKNCPICLANSWTVGEVSELRQFGRGGLLVGGNVVPVFPVICNNCGLTLLFNALVSGVISTPSQEPATEGSEQAAPATRDQPSSS